MKSRYVFIILTILMGTNCLAENTQKKGNFYCEAFGESSGSVSDVQDALRKNCEPNKPFSVYATGGWVKYCCIAAIDGPTQRASQDSKKEKELADKELANRVEANLAAEQAIQGMESVRKDYESRIAYLEQRKQDAEAAVKVFSEIEEQLDKLSNEIALRQKKAAAAVLTR